MRKLLVCLFLMVGVAVARAEQGSEHEHEGSGSAEEHHGSDEHPAPAEHEQALHPEDDDEADPDDPPTDPYDDDGDGVVSPEEKELASEDKAAFSDIPDDVDDKDLDARPASEDLKPSLSIETFQKLVRLTKKIVLQKMEKKIAIKTAAKMEKFSLLIFGFSLAGVLLLGMPLVLEKKFPNQMGLLFKYSALAAVVFFVTVNMFGGVIYGFRTVQGALSQYTNPSTAIAAGTFDTLDDDADYFIVMGKELFAPTLDQMKQHPDEQPGALIMENGMKVVKDAKVFLSIAKLFKKINVIFAILPIVLMALTLVLFILALRPTLVEIVKLPALAAQGASTAGRDVMKKSMARVFGEIKATICTIGVLVLLTLVSSVILGFIVKPAIKSLLEYFALSVSYLQYVKDASSGMVFLALFGVILFLVFNLASLILSMGFFLGKSQKIFQARFNHGVPLATHARFFQWGTPSVLLVQVFPLVFVVIASRVLDWLNDSTREGIADASQVPWSKIMLAGPVFLVAGFLILFWAARGLKAIKFLATYKIPKPKP